MKAKNVTSKGTKGNLALKTRVKKAARPVRRVVRGWSQPTRKQARKYNELILLKTAREILKQALKAITGNISVHGIPKGLKVGFRQARSMQAEKRTLLANKIATKFALDAVGIGYKGKAREIRKKVHDIMRRVVSFITYSARQGHNEAELFEHIKSQLLSAHKELQKELGPIKATVFLKRQAAIMQKLNEEQVQIP